MELELFMNLLRNLNRYVSVCLGLAGVLFGELIAAPLTPEDMQSLQIRQYRHHVQYETYLETNRGSTSVIGFQFDTALDAQTDFVLAIFGAVGGSSGGYGIVGVGLGYHTPLSPNLEWDSRFLVGSGGGGGLPAGGGFALKAQTGVLFPVTSFLSGEAYLGYLMFPTGTFNSWTVSVGVSTAYAGLVLPF